jgi:hypothetical protein
MFSSKLSIRCCQTTTPPTPINMLSKCGLAYKTKPSQALVAPSTLEFEHATSELNSLIQYGQHRKLLIS